jgi:hypothetical protein
MRIHRPLHRNGRAPLRCALGIGLAAVLALAGPAHAADVPSAAMLAPVEALVAFMAKLPQGQHATMFARRGVTILENYPPYIFTGPDAVARWEEGFRKHIADERDVDLKVEFGPAQDFAVTGERAYFSLPTTWTGTAGGRAFEEHGAWSFVLQRAGQGWRILGYGWGVTSLSERSL